MKKFSKQLGSLALASSFVFSTQVVADEGFGLSLIDTAENATASPQVGGYFQAAYVGVSGSDFTNNGYSNEFQIPRAAVAIYGDYGKWSYELGFAISPNDTGSYDFDLDFSSINYEFDNNTIVGAGYIDVGGDVLNVMSSSNLLFMERPVALATQPVLQPGIFVNTNQGPVGLYVSLTQTDAAEDAAGLDDSRPYSFGTRLSFVPIEDGNHVLSVGGNYTYQDYNARYNYGGVSGETSLSFQDVNADTGTISIAPTGTVNNTNLAGLEVAYLRDSLFVMGSYMNQWISGEGDLENISIPSAYVQGGWTFGGHRTFNSSFQTIGTVAADAEGVKPVEVLARFSYLDLTDADGATGWSGTSGRWYEYGAGVNYYASEKVRLGANLMYNQVRSIANSGMSQDNKNGWTYGALVQMRF